jgi:heat shock protein HtpX
VIAIVLIVLAWALSQLVRLALSRSREYLADAGSVELTKNPDAMISALRKIEGRGELPAATSAVMELCLDNPREGFSDLFATHPSVESRVQALVKYAGGHYEGPLALPMHPADVPGGQQETDDRLPPPPPPGSGPWGKAPDRADNLQGVPEGAGGDPVDNRAEPSTGPSSGPWGRH